MVIAAAIAANGSAIRLNLLCRSESKGTERNSVALVELDERLHVVEPEGLDSSGDPTQEEYEHLRHEQEGDSADDEADLSREDHVLKEDGVEGGCDCCLPDPDPRQPHVRHDVREEARHLDGRDNRLEESEQGSENEGEGGKGDFHAQEPEIGRTHF